MSTAVAFTPVTLENAPAVLKDNWLPPDTGIAELDELRDDLMRIRAESSAQSSEVARIAEQIESTRKRNETALRDAYLTGGDPAEAAESVEALEEDLEAGETRSRAASQALLMQINRTVGVIVEKREQWIAELHAGDAQVAEEAAALEGQLREIRSRMGGYRKLEIWLDRTGGDAAVLPQEHFPYGDIPDPEPTDPAELANWKAQILAEASYGGSTYTQVSDAERERDETDVGATYNRQHEQAIEDTNESMAEEAARARLKREMAGEPGVVA